MGPTFTADESKKLAMLVKKRPCLFLHNLSSNRHHNERNYAWEEISDDINITVDACKKQWKSMRDTYIRVKRLQKTPNKKDMSKVSKASLAYYSEVLENTLSFLDDNETSHNQSSDECNISKRGDNNESKKHNYVQNSLMSTSSTSPQHILKNNKRKLTSEISPINKLKAFKDLDTLLNKLDKDEKENSFSDTTTNEKNSLNAFRPTGLYSSSPSTSKKVQQTDNFEALKNEIFLIKSPTKKMASNKDLLMSNEKDNTANEYDIEQEDYDNSDSKDEDVLNNLTLSQSTSMNSLKKKKKKKISTEKVTDKNVKLNKDFAKLLNKLDRNIEEENCERDSATDEENSVLKRTGLYTSSFTSQQVLQSCVSKEGKSDICTEQILTQNISPNNNLLPDNDDKKENNLSVPDNDEEEEPVDVFFKSMALTVKGFSFDMKMRAKKEVFNIISELEIINHNNNN